MGFFRRRNLRPQQYLDPVQEHEVDEMFARVDAEFSPEIRLDRLADLLDELIARRTPLRGVRTAARSGLVRLVFADSTTIVVGHVPPAELAGLLMVSPAQHAVPISYVAGPDGLRLFLRGDTMKATVLVVAADQAD